MFSNEDLPIDGLRGQLRVLITGIKTAIIRTDLAYMRFGLLAYICLNMNDLLTPAERINALGDYYGSMGIIADVNIGGFGSKRDLTNTHLLLLNVLFNLRRKCDLSPNEVFDISMNSLDMAIKSMDDRMEADLQHIRSMYDREMKADRLERKIELEECSLESRRLAAIQQSSMKSKMSYSGSLRKERRREWWQKHTQQRAIGRRGPKK